MVIQDVKSMSQLIGERAKKDIETPRAESRVPRVYLVLGPDLQLEESTLKKMLNPYQLVTYDTPQLHRRESLAAFAHRHNLASGSHCLMVVW